MSTYDLDPTALAKRQLQLDREHTLRFPDLFKRKLTRMKASPLAFLRGAAPLYYELLKARPELAKGPGGEGWLAGDLHLENFGAFKSTTITSEDDAGGKKEKDKKDKKEKPKDKGKNKEKPKKEKTQSVIFNLNDFDEAFVGPWRLDVQRLLTSLILGGRELGADGTRTLALCDRLLDAYVTSAFYNAAPPPPPRPVQALIDALATRSRLAMLNARTQVVKGRRRFLRGERYRDLAPDIAAQVPRAFAEYMQSLPEDERLSAEQADILDCALRVAGTGSLGGLRVAVLVAGKGGDAGQWIFDIKEQGAPSASVLVGAPRMDPAARVVEALHACLAQPPRMLGVAHLGKLSMFCRRLAPQEDKLDLQHLADKDLDSLTSYLGSLLGLAHARGAKTLPKKAWSRADRDAMLDRAITIAGIHEAVYLALCRLMRDL